MKKSEQKLIEEYYRRIAALPNYSSKPIRPGTKPEPTKPVPVEEWREFDKNENKIVDQAESILGISSQTGAKYYGTDEQGLAGFHEFPSLSLVATSGDYSDLSGLPTLGTAAATNSTDYATTAQGALANSALQPEDIGVTVQGYSENTVIDADYSLAKADIAANTLARHDAVTVTDSDEIDFALTGQNITASIKVGSIDETKLDTSINISLGLANSAIQPGDLLTTYGSAFVAAPKAAEIIPLFTAPVPTTVKRVIGMKLSEGTATASITLDGVAILGLSSLGLTNIAQTFTVSGGAGILVAEGSRVALSVISVTGAKNLEFTLEADVPI